MSALVIALLMGASSCEPTAADVDAAGGHACARVWTDRSLRMNDIAAVGTHNSNKLAIPQAELAAMTTVDPRATGLDYAHLPLAEQLDAGVRQLEIDVLNDPQGGRYARPASVLGRAGQGAPTSADFQDAMARPGMKVLHMPDVDFRSSFLTFVACLTQIRDWSAVHPDHAPILIMLNAKTGAASMPGGAAPMDFDAAAWDALDAEIRAVFDAGRLITPDQVRGDHATLREGVLAGGWPTVGEARGKVFFALDEGPEKVAAYARATVASGPGDVRQHRREQPCRRLSDAERSGGPAGSHPGGGAPGLHRPHPRRRRHGRGQGRRRGAPHRRLRQRGAICLDRLLLGRSALPDLRGASAGRPGGGVQSCASGGAVRWAGGRDDRGGAPTSALRPPPRDVEAARAQAQATLAQARPEALGGSNATAPRTLNEIGCHTLLGGVTPS
jgi:hypothetical protein